MRYVIVANARQMGSPKKVGGQGGKPEHGRGAGWRAEDVEPLNGKERSQWGRGAAKKTLRGACKGETAAQVLEWRISRRWMWGWANAAKPDVAEAEGRSMQVQETTQETVLEGEERRQSEWGKRKIQNIEEEMISILKKTGERRRAYSKRKLLSKNFGGIAGKKRISVQTKVLHKGGAWLTTI